MSTLYFEKLSQFDRVAEPVTVSIPFAQGKLPDAAHLVIEDEGDALPSQQRSLSHWSDGSVKWLLVHLQPDLPGNLSKTLSFRIASDPAPQPQQQVQVAEDAGGLLVDTGPLRFRVPREGFLPVRDVVLAGGPAWPAPFAGFTMETDAAAAGSSSGAVELEVDEAGPLRAVILVRGRHLQPDGTEFLALRGRITAYAGKPYIEVEHQFLHTLDMPEVTMQSLRLDFNADQAATQPQLALGEGWYRTSISQSDSEVSQTLDTETMLYQSNEHFIDSYYGDFWCNWRDEQGGLCLSIHQAHQNFPKRLHGHTQGIACWLYPAGEQPAPILQGMAKTHRIQLHFHGSDTPLDALSQRSLQFQLPDRPSLPVDWYRANNPWIETYFPEKLPRRLYTDLNNLHDGRPKALGMMHFGDAPDSGYTNQGRGEGENVWVNNEYDRPHACTLYYALTGQRRALDSALVSARHWLDVDFCHHHPDPLIDGGLRLHTRYHATGRCIPSHEWTEGFLDYYFLTGRRESLEVANSIGENILRHMQLPSMQQLGEASVREGGWALRAYVGLWLGTGEQRWRDEARQLIEMFLDWHDEFGALLAPYTSHTMPRVPFMISLTVCSFARYLLIEDDERVKRLIVSVMDDLIEHCLGPDGVFYYKELPSLQRTAPTPHALEALTYAWRISGDERYLRVAANTFAALMFNLETKESGPKFADPSGAVIDGVGGGRIFADKYTSLILYAGAAAPLGLLDWYEYPYPGAA
ncbi:MAG: hypothetical protein OXH73_00905 [Caldilineaceae bacterium]|nr:hypothetical protein [Caldilineaceae bacterium]